jgi:hypothetical protein
MPADICISCGLSCFKNYLRYTSILFTIINQSMSFTGPFLAQQMCGLGNLLCLVHIQDYGLLTQRTAHNDTNVTDKTGR